MSTYFNRALRPNKRASYDHLFSGISGPLKNVLLMPSDRCNDVIYLMEMGIIDPRYTQLWAVERDFRVYRKMMQRLAQLGWHRGENLHDFCGYLHDMTELPFHLDLIFIDLFGSLLLRDAQFMAKKLAPRMTDKTHLALTVGAIPRNNLWLPEYWRAMLEAYPAQVAQFRAWMPGLDELHERPVLWLMSIFHQFSLTTDVLVYSEKPSCNWKMLAIRASVGRNARGEQQYCSQTEIEQMMDIPGVALKYATMKRNSRKPSFVMEGSSGLLPSMMLPVMTIQSAPIKGLVAQMQGAAPIAAQAPLPPGERTRLLLLSMIDEEGARRRAQGGMKSAWG